MTDDHMQIFIRDCRVALYVGIYAHEMHQPQPVVINVTIETALMHHYDSLAERDLGKVIDYERIRNYICEELPKCGHIPLLETVAEQIVTFCFTDPRIEKAEVRIEKPRIFPETEAVGIALCRKRPVQI